ncbi:MAG TPA: class I SAM-dependent methyltransferase [Planctomicrobium sp.]|nr:class I SAM-dependent methyltransferase [Planctomicrobium sp.]
MQTVQLPNVEKENAPLAFTGEYFVPGKSPQRIADDHLERYRFAQRYVQGKHVLDIACGIGYGSQFLLEGGAASYQGVDIQEQVIEQAQEIYGTNDARFSVDSITTFQASRPFDVIVCFETIEHVPDFRGALKNLSTLLAPNGTLLISSPHRHVVSPYSRLLTDKPRNRFHVQEFVPEELMEELDAVGFEKSKQELYGQRQRKMTRSRFMRKLKKMLFPNPDETTSPQVTAMSPSLTPRYFVVVAHR